MYLYYGLISFFTRNSARLVIALLFTLLLFVFFGPLRASEIPRPYDAEGQLAVLEGYLAAKPDRYRLLVLDTFENLRPYDSHASSSALDDIRFVYRSPENRAFRQEKDMVTAFGTGEISFEQCLFVHTSFELPGQQVFEFRPRVTVPFHGQPVRVSVWIHSQMYRHRLALLFENADSRPVRVDAGYLNWNGWRRVSLELPAELHRRGRGPGKPFGGKFMGFLIESSPNSEAGDVALMFDDLLLLTDMGQLQYPGSEISDTWK